MPKLKTSAPKKAKAARVKSEMGKFKTGTMHSGSKTGPKVTNPKQAVAIALSESGQSHKKAAPDEQKIAEKIKHHRGMAAKHRAHADLHEAKLKIKGKRLNYDGHVVEDNGGY